MSIHPLFKHLPPKKRKKKKRSATSWPVHSIVKDSDVIFPDIRPSVPFKTIVSWKMLYIFDTALFRDLKISIIFPSLLQLIIPNVPNQAPSLFFPDSISFWLLCSEQIPVVKILPKQMTSCCSFIVKCIQHLGKVIKLVKLTFLLQLFMMFLSSAFLHSKKISCKYKRFADLALALLTAEENVCTAVLTKLTGCTLHHVKFNILFTG